jgi:hypothetical protein
MLAQSFGAETSAVDADTLTAVEFDKSGDYLVTGDQSGRIVLFARVLAPEKSSRTRKGTNPGDDERKDGRAEDKVLTCSFVMPLEVCTHRLANLDLFYHCLPLSDNFSRHPFVYLARCVFFHLCVLCVLSPVSRRSRRSHRKGPLTSGSPTSSSNPTSQSSTSSRACR